MTKEELNQYVIMETETVVDALQKIDKNANDNIDNGGRIATATLLINNMFLIHCVTLVSGKNGIFVSMPSIKKSDGSYQDYAFFTTKEEREKITMLVMKEYLNRVSFFNEPIASNMKVNLFLEEKGKQKAYATVVVDEKMNINRIRVMEGKDGLFVSMPQYKDRHGEYQTVICPASSEAYAAITNLVMNEYIRQTENETM